MHAAVRAILRKFFISSFIILHKNSENPCIIVIFAIMYDIVIVGAGVIGATMARCLSKYDLKVLVLEKNSDVGDETSGANSAIVHSGYDPHRGTLKAALNIRGNKLFPQLCREMNLNVKG